jgi:hypothetical protein
MTTIAAIAIAAALNASMLPLPGTVSHPTTFGAMEVRRESEAVPAVEIADQASRAVLVRGVRPGARVDVYANGDWVGAAYARSSIVRVPLRYQVKPGMRLTASQRAGAFENVSKFTSVTVDYTTYHFDAQRDGWNPYESTLNTTNVASGGFGPLFTIPTDAQVYAQPLYVSSLTLPDTTVHNVLYVATTNDTLYAFDADTGATLWQDTFINTKAGINNVTAGNVDNANVYPTIGIVGTPVIDRTADAIFVVTTQRIGSGVNAVFEHQLHSLTLETGAENAQSPVVLSASMQFTDGSTQIFNSQRELNRPALLLSNGQIYIAFGSHGDAKSAASLGWMMAYDEYALTQTAVFTTVRDPAPILLDSIWAGGFGPSADEFDNIYFATGNGAWDANTGGTNFGNSVLKLGPLLTFEDYLTPQFGVQDPVKDLGSGGVMVLPDQNGAFQHLAVIQGKGVELLLVNRDALGEYTAPPHKDNVVQDVHPVGSLYKGVHGGPAYYTNANGQYVFVVANLDHLRAYQLQTSPSTQLVLAGESPNTFPGEGGSIPVVSSDGQTAGTGIVWATTRPNNISTTPIMLYAYDASNVSSMLYQGNVGNWFNVNGNPYLTPTVINGKVYVGYGNGVAVFGLQSEERSRRTHASAVHGAGGVRR